jgi:hypothetical protein
MALSPALVGMDTIQIMQYGLIALGFVGSLYTAYRIAKSNHHCYPGVHN